LSEVKLAPLISGQPAGEYSTIIVITKWRTLYQ